MKFASDKLKKFAKRVAIGTTAIICLLVGTLAYSDRNDGEKLVWASVKFRSDIDRWPKSSSELYARATTDFNLELQPYIGILIVVFGSPVRTLTIRPGRCTSGFMAPTEFQPTGQLTIQTTDHFSTRRFLASALTVKRFPFTFST